MTGLDEDGSGVFLLGCVSRFEASCELKTNLPYNKSTRRIFRRGTYDSAEYWSPDHEEVFYIATAIKRPPGVAGVKPAFETRAAGGIARP